MARKLPPNARWKDGGIVASASIGRGPGKRKDKCFPADTENKDIKAWQDATRTALRDGTPTAGSMLEEMETHYLPIKRRLNMPTIVEREADLRRMFAILGPTKRRDQIRPVDVLAMLSQLKAAGRANGTRVQKDGRVVNAGGHTVKVLKNQTVKSLQNAIRNFFTVMGGKRGHNPAAEITEFNGPDDDDLDTPAPVVPTLELFDRILAAMPDMRNGVRDGDPGELNLSKLRLNVLAFAGLPFKQIKGIDPAKHIDWEECRVTVARRKGKGTGRKVIEVGDYGMAALRVLVDAGGCGVPFTACSVWKGFKKAVEKVAPGVHTYPYLLRHMFGTTMVDASQDLDATSRLMAHLGTATTQVYVKAAIARANRRAVDAFDLAVTATREAAAEKAAREAMDRAKAANTPAVVSRGCVGKTKRVAKKTATA